MLRTITVILMLLILTAAAVSQQPVVTIDVPRDRAEVPWRACLSGVTTDENAKLIAVIHPMEISSYFVQPSITHLEHGRFELLLYVGEGSPGLHAGKRFEIRVFSSPDEPLREGMVLPDWPSAQSASPVVRVVRNDAAPSGCEEALPTVGSQGAVLAHVDRFSEPRPPAPVGMTEIGRLASKLLDFTVGVGCLVLGLLFLALLIVTDRAERGVMRLSGWLATFRGWLVAVALKFLACFRWLWAWLLKFGGRWVRPIWTARGFTGNLRDFAARTLWTPLLVAATIYSLYADARTIVQALNPLFGVQESQARYGVGGILAEIMPAGHDVASQPEQGPTGKTALQIVAKGALHFVESFENLSGEKLGFLALALAGLEGAFGIVLLWGFGADESVVVRPVALLKARPLLTACFLTLNLALGVLAAYRGYELSPSGMNWLMPTMVSAAIALVMPWILTFTLHYAIECAADCLGVTKSVALIATLYLGIFCTAALWALLSLFVVGLVAAVFVGFFVFCVVSWAFLMFSELLGEALRKLRRGAWPDLRLPLPVRAVPASLALLFVVGGGYYILRGLVQ